MAYHKMAVYRDWITERLPADIPPKILEQALNLSDYYQDGLIVAILRERSSEMDIQYTAKNDQDLKLYQFKFVCNDIAYAMEMAARKQSEKLWRYIRIDAVDGQWRFRENRHYHYNTIFDTRLDWFERYLKLIHPVVSSADWANEIAKKEQLMNCWFPEPHWSYDKERLCFIEISDSKERDTHGEEELRPGSVLPRFHLFRRK